MDISGYLIQLAEIFHHQLLVYFLGAVSGVGLEIHEYIYAAALQPLRHELPDIQLLVFRKECRLDAYIRILPVEGPYFHAYFSGFEHSLCLSVSGH